jgi:tetratricopeptide (TPR) repeat protein
MALLRRAVPVVVAATLLAPLFAGLAAAQTGYVNGIVRDPSGDGVEDALVVAFSAPWQRREETTTNGSGRFSFVGLQAGQWLFLAQRAGYSPVQAFAPVRASGLGPRVVLMMEIDPLSAPTPETGALANVHADDLHALIDAADALFDLGNYDRAIDAYEAVLERAPPLTSLHLQIGHAYREQAETERALEAYRSVPSDTPAGAEATAAIEEIVAAAGSR